jgi:hypothetical protein
MISKPVLALFASRTDRRYGAGGEDGNFVAAFSRWSAAMPQPNDLSRSLVALDQNSTIIAVVELSRDPNGAAWKFARLAAGGKRFEPLVPLTTEALFQIPFSPPRAAHRLKADPLRPEGRDRRFESVANPLGNPASGP